MSKDTGGPAYPVIQEDMNGVEGGPGMTLRDWFAGQALAGHLASLNPGSFDRGFCDHVSKQSYWVADSMIAERNKP
jgi:hypothetical protein